MGLVGFVLVAREADVILTSSQVLCPEVGIPLWHSKVLVPCDSGNFHDIEPLLKEPAGCFVSKIMEPEVNDTSLEQALRHEVLSAS